MSKRMHTFEDARRFKWILDNAIQSVYYEPLPDGEANKRLQYELPDRLEVTDQGLRGAINLEEMGDLYSLDNKKIVVFNGPKSCGKDVAISYIQDHLQYKQDVIECKDNLHLFMMMFYHLNEFEYYSYYEDRELKETPNIVFSTRIPEVSLRRFLTMIDVNYLDFMVSRSRKANWEGNGIGQRSCRANLSCREAMIYISEFIVKPAFGKNYFGEARCKAVVESQAELIMDGSCGFVDELDAIKSHYPDDILLIRVHREGYSFKGDSRDYIPDGVISNTIDIHNCSTEDIYKESVASIVDQFMKGEL